MINYFSTFLLGLTTIIYQILMVREIFSIFSGNEITVSVFLSFWMILTGIGAYIGDLIKKYFNDRTEIAIEIHMFSVLLMPVVFIFLKVIVPYLIPVPGEIVSIFILIFIIFIVLTPICLSFGMWFTFCSELFRKTKGLMAYTVEMSGAVSGGLIASYFLIKSNIFTNIVIIMFLNLLIITIILFVLKKYRNILFLSIIFLFVSVFLLSDRNTEKIELEISRLQWHGFSIKEIKNSIYGKFTVIENEGQFSIYENSMHIFSTENQQYNEELINLCLLTNKNPRNILIVSGGIANIFEALKHSPENVVYVDIDPEIIKIQKKYSWPENNYNNVSIINEDARCYIKKTENKFDCIILDIPDPVETIHNRYFTLEFFYELKRILKQDGVIIFGLSSSENYMNEELKILSGSIYRTALNVFDNIEIVHGTNNYFLLSDKEVSLNSEILINEMKKRKIAPLYLTEFNIRKILDDRRKERVMRWITEKKDVIINRDFYPVSYIYGLLYWLSMVDGNFIDFITFLYRYKIYILLTFIILLSVLIFVLLPYRNRKRIFYGIILTGAFISMTLQIIVLFSFQTVYGYLYGKIGFLLTSGLAGVAVGSFISNKYLILNGEEKINKIILLTLILTAIYSVFIIFMVKMKEHMYYLMAFLTGLPSGIIFPLAGSIISESERKTGTSYFIDLLGAAKGTILTGVIIIPVSGIYGSCILISILCLVSAGFLGIRKNENR